MIKNDKHIPDLQRPANSATNNAKQSNLSDFHHAAATIICNYVKRGQDLDESYTWPIAHIGPYKLLLAPKRLVSAGSIPDSLILFLEYDFRIYSSFEVRSDHPAWSIDERGSQNIKHLSKHSFSHFGHLDELSKTSYSKFRQTSLYHLQREWIRCISEVTKCQVRSRPSYINDWTFIHFRNEKDVKTRVDQPEQLTYEK